VSGTGIQPDFARPVAELGTHWENRAMSFKPFATGCVIHPFIDATVELMREHRVDWRAIARVTLPIADYLVPVVCEPVSQKKRPTDVFNARVSLQYLIAETLYLGRFDIHSVEPQSLRDPALLALVDRVDYEIDRDPADRRDFRGWVRIEKTDGVVLERKLDRWRRMHVGEPDTAAAVERKFLENVAERAGRDGARQILDLARDLASGLSVREFMAASRAILRTGRR
jgi:2-methylcitrate dehydratase PrpD